ncbi:DinB family protein [Pontibacter sp. G13]|uniref:DinB family protein n=1 Tax=Pontibacter sp. G13 TaxID=3074898 RepID=UPI00288984F9|nr:DinB family protein [Pontibacter sp. G13]WNJ21401.1 DinB family protein [Pontibacter sp. G13]
MPSNSLSHPAFEAFFDGLYGKNAHISPMNALDGLTTDTVSFSASNAPYTIWEIIGHIIFWQDWFEHLLKTGERRPVPHAEDGWPYEGGPKTQESLEAACTRLIKYTQDMEVQLLSPDMDLTQPKGDYATGFHVVQAAANHMSYHLGQIMLLRRMEGNYPPPSGGETW